MTKRHNSKNSRIVSLYDIINTNKQTNKFIFGDIVLMYIKLCLEKIENSVVNRTLANGLKLIWLPSSLKHKFYLATYVNVGSRYEKTNQSGISHFLEHMMFRGSKNFPSFKELAHEFENIAGEWNAATSHEHTEYCFDGFSKDIEKIIPLFCEFIYTPKLLDIEKERQVILREIEDELNEYQQSTDLNHHSLKLIWPNSGLAQAITGTKESTQKISLNDLKNFYTNYYQPENMVFCAIGGQDPQHILGLIEKSLSKFKQPKPLKKISKIDNIKQKNTPLSVLIPDSNNQYCLQVNFVCDPEDSSNYPSYLLLSHLLSDGLSSLLSYRIREELGLVYDIQASYQGFKEKGLFSINFNTTEDKINLALKETLNILIHNLTTFNSTEDLKKAKIRALASLQELFYDLESLSFYFAKQQLSQQKYPSLSQLGDSIEALKEDDVRCAASKLFTKQNISYVVMGADDNKVKLQLDKTISDAFTTKIKKIY